MLHMFFNEHWSYTIIKLATQSLNLETILRPQRKNNVCASDFRTKSLYFNRLFYKISILINIDQYK